MTRFKEHPEIEMPAFALALGFRDVSWHNEACGRCEVVLAGNESDVLTLWVDYDDLDAREFATPKFGAYRGDPEWNMGEQDCVYEGDDAEACERAVRACLAAAGHPLPAVTPEG